VSEDGSVQFAAQGYFGRPPPHREIEIQRSDLLRIWPEPAEATREPTRASADPLFQKRRRGPLPGTLDRYGQADRALFSELERIMGEDKVSVSEAARRLAEKDKVVAGIGSPSSRAKRLAERYRRERQN
jgi:hypothetical protein